MHGGATLLLLANIIRPMRDKRWPAGMWHLTTSYFWIFAPVLVAPLIIAGVAGFPAASIEQNAPQALIYGWVLQFAFALLPYFFTRVFRPAAEARLGGNWFSLIASHLAGILFWTGIFATDYQGILQGTAYLLWFLAMMPIVDHTVHGHAAEHALNDIGHGAQLRSDLRLRIPLRAVQRVAFGILHQQASQALSNGTQRQVSDQIDQLQNATGHPGNHHLRQLGMPAHKIHHGLPAQDPDIGRLQGDSRRRIRAVGEHADGVEGGARLKKVQNLLAPLGRRLADLQPAALQIIEAQRRLPFQKDNLAAAVPAPVSPPRQLAQSRII